MSASSDHTIVIRTARRSFPTRVLRAIGNPESKPAFLDRLWIPGQAFGLPGMTALRQINRNWASRVRAQAEAKRVLVRDIYGA
jgi:hypothetical protein